MNTTNALLLAQQGPNWGVLILVLIIGLLFFGPRYMAWSERIRNNRRPLSIQPLLYARRKAWSESGKAIWTALGWTARKQQRKLGSLVRCHIGVEHSELDEPVLFSDLDSGNIPGILRGIPVRILKELPNNPHSGVDGYCKDDELVGFRLPLPYGSEDG